MPWLDTQPMNEKLKFISAYLDNSHPSFQHLCARFNISPKTGYKYLKRYNQEGIDGLKERSKAPHHPAHKLPSDVEQNILAVKFHHPTWGAKKILNWLTQENPTRQWPARSTLEELLKRHQLVIPRKRKRYVAPYTQPFKVCQAPNDIWSIDYKGQFVLGNNELCYPLTVTDNFSRYVLAIDGFHQISGKRTRQILEELFREFGLPLAIRSDNGVPFAGNGLAGLSTLAVWLIKLGIIPERIRKGHPQENGRHERMHFTLKQETASPPQFNQTQQQHCFDEFRQIFNEQRPHEGIDFDRPAWRYASSKRAYTKKLPPVEYDSTLLTRAVRLNGTMKWKNKEIFISETLIGERIALKPYATDEWVVYFSFMPIGIFNEKVLRINKI